MTTTAPAVPESSADVRWRLWLARNAREDHRRDLWFRAIGVVLFVIVGALLVMQVLAHRAKDATDTPETIVRSTRAESRR